MFAFSLFYSVFCSFYFVSPQLFIVANDSNYHYKIGRIEENTHQYIESKVDTNLMYYWGTVEVNIHFRQILQVKNYHYIYISRPNLFYPDILKLKTSIPILKRIQCVDDAR